jgi:Membrane bound beta barrel domain (DUF5777)
MKKIILLASLLSATNLAQAQDDLMNVLDDGSPKQRNFVSATFKGTRLINMHTIETQGKRTLNFMIMHRFGTVNGGLYHFFGIDGGASIRLGLEYSYDGRLEIGFGRTSVGKMLDLYGKYRILRQTINKSDMPVSLTAYAGSYYSTLERRVNGIDVYADEKNRLAYNGELILGRKFSERFSAQVAPYVVYYNLTELKADNHLNYGVSAAFRYKFTMRTAITGEYAYRLNNYSVANTYYNSLGIGIDIETGGHVFQMHFTNSFGLVESQFLTQTTDSWKNVGIRLGFNISRAFAL